MQERLLISDATTVAKILIKTWRPGQTEIPWGQQGAQTSDHMGYSSLELWRDQPILFHILELSGSAITLYYTQFEQLIASKKQ